MAKQGLQELRECSLEQLATHANSELNPFERAVHAEFERRTAKAQIDAARYMKWSVIALAATAALNALFGCLAWLFPNPLHFH